MGAARWQVPRNSLRLVTAGGAMTCPTGKHPFTQAQAADKARRASRRYSTDIAAYHCAECGFWHVGQNTGLKQPVKTIRNNHQLRFL